MTVASRIVSLGDSVNWGQGLLEAEKFDRMLALTRSVPPSAVLDRLAHSGAIIGNPTTAGGVEPGEVPNATPSILAQCAAYAEDPERVDVILVNGGINDVGVATILNPLARIPSLDARIETACYTQMSGLLRAVATKFSAPGSQILLLGYYAILSAASDPRGVAGMLAMHGVAMQDFGNETLDVVASVTDRCEQFYRASNACFERAVAAVGDPRIRFVDSGFTAANAAFAGDTAYLWGLDLADALDPVDPVAAERHTLCEIAHPHPTDLLARELCFRASAGHPNVSGAAQYYRQIMAALG